MKQHRYEELFYAVRLSEQRSVCPVHMHNKTYCWQLVQDFVDAFNLHCVTMFTPSGILCLEKSMIRWYRLGGHWIPLDLPHYTPMEQKPNNGCEIQTFCCANSGIMLCLQIVKSKGEIEHPKKISMGLTQVAEGMTKTDLKAGTIVVLEITAP